MKNILIIMTVGLLLFIGNISVVFAQVDTNTFAIEVEDQHLKLYSVDETGHFVFESALPGFYIFDKSGINNPNEWQIPRAQDIALSPDRNELAFTAVRLDTQETALFLYDINALTFQTVATSGIGKVIWAPNSTKILLTPPDTFLGGQYPTLNLLSVYDTLSNSLDVFLEDQANFATSYAWLPNSNYLIFAGLSEACDGQQPCLVVNNLYLLNLEDYTTIQLTELNTLDPANIGLEQLNYYNCNIGALTWSDEFDRIFFSLDCQISGERIFSSLHSVNLLGEHRIEDTLTHYPVGVIGTQILDIFVGDTIYVPSMGAIEHSIEEAVSISGYWQIISLDGTEQSSNIVSQTFSNIPFPPVYEASISPNGEKVALSGTNISNGLENIDGYIAIVDLNTAQISSIQPENGVCSIEWVNENTIRYQVFSTSCSDAYRVPLEIWQHDLTTGYQTEITSDLNGAVWILDAPDLLINPNAKAFSDN